MNDKFGRLSIFGGECLGIVPVGLLEVKEESYEEGCFGIGLVAITEVDAGIETVGRFLGDGKAATDSYAYLRGMFAFDKRYPQHRLEGKERIGAVTEIAMPPYSASDEDMAVSEHIGADE